MDFPDESLSKAHVKVKVVAYHAVEADGKIETVTAYGKLTCSAESSLHLLRGQTASSTTAGSLHACQY